MAAQAWLNLETCYKAASPAQIFGDFQLAITFQLAGRDPVPDIERLGNLFATLKEEGVNIPDFLQALILAKGIPKEWQSLSTTLFQVYGTDHFTFANISDCIIGEYRRRSAVQPNVRDKQKANKISGVKRKEKEADWRDQKPGESGEAKGERPPSSLLGHLVILVVPSSTSSSPSPPSSSSCSLVYVLSTPSNCHCWNPVFASALPRYHHQTSIKTVLSTS